MQSQRIRHQVAIAGQVTNAQTKQVIAGVEVRITEAPEAFTDLLKVKSLQYGDRWKAMIERPDRTRTAFDGHFHFLDLPPGEYNLIATLPNAVRCYSTAQITVPVSRQADDKIIMARADMVLSPTTLKGKISDQDADPIVLAEVRVKNSTERVYSNKEGQYLLMGLEAKENYERTVLVSAQGYQPTSQKVVLSQPGAEETLNFVLQK